MSYSSPSLIISHNTHDSGTTANITAGITDGQTFVLIANSDAALTTATARIYYGSGTYYTLYGDAFDVTATNDTILQIGRGQVHRNH